MKAEYSSRPDEAAIKVKDGTAYIVLCQNIVEKEEQLEDELGLPAGTRVAYECDEHQIICPADALDLEDVRENPGRYMDYAYVPPRELTPEEERMQELEDAIVELAEIIAGE